VGVIDTFGLYYFYFLGGGYGYLRATLPDYNGELTIAGLKDKVEIIHDAYGIPHIYAQMDEDAYFALGYCMAQDQLFQMNILRRAARGRRAEIFGQDLVLLDSVLSLDELRVPPGNRLEALSGNRQRQHSIRINDQYRVCFRWTETGSADAEITDYH
jgi:plasmid maintenance system killer protein